MPGMTIPYMSPHLAVFCTHAHLHGCAAELAAGLSLPVAAESDAWDMLLLLESIDTPPGYRLVLQQIGANAPGPVYVDFVGGPAGHRRRAAEGRKQPLARAAGLKHGALPFVIDATGGLGRDALVLATLGCRVLILERSPVVAALLQNGLTRALADAATAPVAQRMSVINTDARVYLPTLSGPHRPDVIYLDPMYPPRDKSALVKKEMRVLRALLGDDPDAAELTAAARRCAQHRVVIKRPRRAPPLSGVQPTMCIENETTRFDVYLVTPG